MEPTDQKAPDRVGARRYPEGTRIGPYEVVGRIGAGGMGEVFRAHDTRLRRDVAIKVLPPRLTCDPDSQRRFETEARAAASLMHPNVVAVFDVGTHEGAPYIVTELVEGQPLAGKLPLARALDAVRQIALALAAVHDDGIVHRDLKPANLLVTPDGTVKIVDFGLAKLLAGTSTEDGHTETGAILGTAGYMSPEQVRGLRVDHRSDLFSLGVVLYELLSGEKPFGGASSIDRLTATLEHQPPPVEGVPPWLARVLDRCLDKDPERRFQNARDLALALEPPVASAPAPARRRRVGVIALAVLVLGGAAATVAIALSPAPAPVSAAPASSAVTPDATMAGTTGAPLPASVVAPVFSPARPPDTKVTPSSARSKTRRTSPPKKPVDPLGTPE